ncbi:MAG: TIGR03087 family PEP-CTERM/XrtA system glycosyltransferase, partial [Burkholderiaceae bacterium]
MANLLYLVHRLPFPPNKGDKVRSYHLLKHLSERHRVYLGTFVDDPADEMHVPRVRAMCADLHVVKLRPSIAKVRSLGNLFTGQAMSLRFYGDSGMRAWVERVHGEHGIDATVVFSSAMAQYAWLGPEKPGAPTLIDFVDVDSAKWSQYATQHRWPFSWVYGLEGRRLLEYERKVALRAQRAFFVTEKETALFQQLAPECAPVIEAMGNGVDSDFFRPFPDRANPFGNAQIPIVFTGAMDYWPNVDAAKWFV